jgi:outer membrane protein assembly factor BamB
VRRTLLIVLGLVVLLAAGVLIGAYRHYHHGETAGSLETSVTGVSVETGTTAPPPKPKPLDPSKRTYRYLPDDRLCWNEFGGDPQRTSARPNVHLGKPTRYFWSRNLHSYVEYAPSYCDGVLYVNTFAGFTWALDSHNGRVLWKHRNDGHTPSTPAIAGTRLLVSSNSGETVTALRREDGALLWKLRLGSRVESSPVAIGNTAYFGATDGRLFAVDVRSGRVRWAYETGGRINASPSVWGNRVCVDTYAGSVFCLDRRNGHHLWHRYVKRDFVRYESFYASPSTDGRRLFTVSRAGRVVALDARNGRMLWSHHLGTTGYSTPSIAHGRVFVGDFAGNVRAYRAGDGRELWRRHVGGRVLAPGLVAGKLVFFSTLDGHTYALLTSNGRIVWRLAMGKYQPGIATDRHYYFTLNGRIVAYHAQTPARYKTKLKKKR